jgi:DnaA family protein
MKQIALDIGLDRGPTLASFCAGPNEAALAHLKLWCASPTRSPVPTYLWGGSGSGKTHLLRAVGQALSDQGASVGWLDATLAEPPAFDERWGAVLMDDTHLYTAVQQHAALPPADLKLREDLRTRLGWGHVFQLQVLSETERRAVLRQVADTRGVFLGDEVMDYMLTRFARDLGSLMQLLEHLDLYALQTKRAITIPLIRSMLENE